MVYFTAIIKSSYSCQNRQLVQLPDNKHTGKSERLLGSLVDLNVFTLLVWITIARYLTISNIGRLNDIMSQVLTPCREKIRSQFTLLWSASGFSHCVRNSTLNFQFGTRFVLGLTSDGRGRPFEAHLGDSLPSQYSAATSRSYEPIALDFDRCSKYFI